MVYDESKNYIGDSHWREDEDLQEGTELKLDKGVLVDVGERIGRTETDLNSLLEKRRPEHGSSPTRAPLQPISLSSVSRTNGNQTQGRPKSLSAILGASQGPIGRARLPTKTPYEQRQDAVPASSRQMEPPAKRARLDATRVGTVPQTNLLASAPAPRAATTVSSPMTDRPLFSKKPVCKEVMEISSEPTSTPLRSSSLPGSQVQDTNYPHAVLPDQISAPAKPPKQPSKQPPKQMAHSAERAAMGLPKPSVSSPSVSSARGASSASSNKLRLASHKPRRKLMYKDLPPGSKQSTHPTSAGGMGNLNGQPRARTARGKDDSTSMALDSKAENLLTKSPRTTDLIRDVTRGGGLSDAFTQSSSPLFMPELPNEVPRALLTPEALGASAYLPPSPFMPHKSLKLPILASNGPIELGAEHMRTQESGGRASPPMKASILTVLDHQLLAKPPQILTSRSTLMTKSFRRVVSESESPNYRTTSRASNAATGGLVLPESTLIAAQKAFESPPRLPRSHSESGAVYAATAMPALQPVSEAFEQDIGPWSKMEAFLLFDWHPPDRERLVISDLKQTDEHNRFGARKGMLSDQIDAF